MTEVAAPELAVAELPRHRRHPLVAFLLRRLVAGIATLFAVSILLFAGTNILRGTSAAVFTGVNRKALLGDDPDELDTEDGYDFFRAKYHEALKVSPYRKALQELAGAATRENVTLLHQGAHANVSSIEWRRLRNGRWLGTDSFFPRVGRDSDGGFEWQSGNSGGRDGPFADGQRVRTRSESSGRGSHF